MTVRRRIEQQPAFILHHRPFRDTSQILDVLSRDHGKVAIVARGSRGPRSRLKGVLRPFMPLSLSWVVGGSDLGTLTGAEVRGAPLRLVGEELLAGYYVNELLLSFLHRHDPQPAIFDTYAGTLRALAAAEHAAPCLRQFEIGLLRDLGYALELERDALEHEPLVPEQDYEYRVERGAVPVADRAGRMVFSGRTLTAIAAHEFGDAATLRAAGRLLREVIAYHLGGKELRSRKVLLELRRGKITDSNGGGTA